MRKKVVCSILVVIMMSVMFAGCFNEKNSAVNKNDNVSQNHENTGVDGKFDEGNAIKVGEVIEFGRYEQDGNLENGTENIEWLVLDVVDNKALLITKDALYATKHAEYKYAKWDESLVKYWLQEFEASAFSDVEKSRLTHECLCSDKSVYCSEDNVFVLSGNEAQELSEAVPQIYDSWPTEYAKQQGVLSFVNESTDTHPEYSELNGKSLWWVRSWTPSFPGGMIPTNWPLS